MISDRTVVSPSTPDQTSAGLQGRVSRRPVWLVCLLVLGLVISQVVGRDLVWVWLGGAAILIALGFWWRFRPGALLPQQGAAVTAGLAIVFLAAARLDVQVHRVARHDLAGFVDETEQLWRLEGRILTEPVVRTVGGGSMSRFGYQGPTTFFQLQVEQALDIDGQPIDVTGLVLVRLNYAEYRLRVGDELRVLGMIASFPPAANPGETDRAELARVQGLAGVMEVETRGNAEPLGYSPGPLWRFRRWQAGLRRQAAGWIHRDLPPTEDTRREALLAALLLGDRGAGLDGLDDAFRRVGLAHLLSISGLHLSIFIATGLVFVRFTHAPPRLERVAMMILVLGYLFLVPARVPVWRAGVMLLTFLVAGLSGRRLDPVNVLAVAASVVLLWRPTDLFTPGFQLSFGVVYGLMTLTMPLRRKWFGEPPDIELISIPEMVAEWVKTAIAGASVAWLVSLPMIAHHFGMICALAMPMTLLALPLAWIILGLGYLKALTAVLWPSAGVILGHPIALGTDALIGLVQWADGVPLSTINIGFPGVTWMILALGAVVIWCRHDWRDHARARRFVAIVSVALLLWPLALPSFQRWRPGQPAARLTMLAVGNGSCYVMESDGETIMFDAGSGSFLGVGDRTIIPALRRMGITSVPTIILSHADVDHFAAAVELIENMKTTRLIVPPHMLKQQRFDPFGPVAVLLQQAERAGVTIDTATAGTTRSFGAGVLTWWHPDETEDQYRNDNDRSAVVSFDIAGRRVLLTGDVQTAAIAHLFQKFPDEMKVDVLEMPHHGGWSDASLEFVRSTGATVLLQSTGASRLRRDRWPEQLESGRRFVTMRDGAVTVSIAENGEITVSTYRGP